MNKYTIPVVVVALLIGFTACNKDSQPEPEQDNSPVRLNISLEDSKSRATRTAKLTPQQLPANSELTMKSTLTAGNANIFMPALRGYTPHNGTNTAEHLAQAKSLIGGNTIETLSLLAGTPQTPDETLQMKHLDTDAPTTAGLVVTNGTDMIYGNTNATTNAAYAYTFKDAQHANTKISVQLISTENEPITNAEAVYIDKFPTAIGHNYHGCTDDNKQGFCIIESRLNTALPTKYPFAHPATTDTPDNLWNIIAPATRSTDETISILNADGTLQSNGVNIATAQLCITMPEYMTGNLSMPARTYSLSLGDVNLAGLPDGDPRITNANDNSNTGKMTHTLNGEHIIITVRIHKQDPISGTASIAEWSIATANNSIGTDDTTDTQLPE